MIFLHLILEEIDKLVVLMINLENKLITQNAITNIHVNIPCDVPKTLETAIIPIISRSLSVGCDNNF